MQVKLAKMVQERQSKALARPSLPIKCKAVPVEVEPLPTFFHIRTLCRFFWFGSLHQIQSPSKPISTWHLRFSARIP